VVFLGWPERVKLKPQNNNKIKHNKTMKKLLSQKDLTPQDKLVIIVINDNLMFGECKLTSNEIGALSGLSRKKVVDTLDKLCEMDMLKCTVQGQFRSRTTKPTERLQNLIKE